VVLLGTTGVVDVVVFLLLARAMRIEEVQEVVGLLTSRLPSRLRRKGASRPTA
jgi:hypothetical protein